MGPLDEQLLLQAKGFLAVGCPGLCERLEALEGEWLPTPEAPEYAKHSGRVKCHIAYRVPKLKLRISFKIWFTVVNDQWEIFSCAYHCGPSDNTEAHHFRFCRPDPRKGEEHFHLRGYDHLGKKGHIPLWRSVPPLDKDPMKFMELIERFVTNKELPLGVK